MNLPNKLTVLRVLMIPFFVVFLLYDITGPADKWIALVLFCVASLTDMLDGKIARKYNSMVSDPCPLIGYYCKRIYHQWIPSCSSR